MDQPILPNQNPEKLSYSPNYDKELENQTEKDYSEVMGILNMEYAAPNYPYVIRNHDGSLFLRDPFAIMRLTKVLKNMKTLFIKYRENLDRINQLEKKILGASSLPLFELITDFSEIGDKFIEVMALNHNFKDRTEKIEPWENQTKKKLNLPELEGEYLDFFNKYCNRKWKRISFYWTQYNVQRKGDIHCLVSGVNDSGKTNTIIPMLKFANFCFRECWHVYEDDKQTIDLHKFNIDKDVVYDADPKILNEFLAADKYYQTIDATEGMGTGTNLESMNKEVIKFNVKAYRIRSHHSIFAYEYQVESRVPRMMQQRFNSWLKKMSWYHAVFSIPSFYYRHKDPLYLKRLDELDDDRKLSKWFSSKRTNPNYIVKFKAPHMGPKMQARFNKNMQLADERIMKAEEVQDTVSGKQNMIIKELWEEIDGNRMSYVDIIPYLQEKGLKESQIKKLINRYDDYDSIKKLMRKKTIKVQETV